ncbi:MAG: 5-(carboxyamino)imidazole ribonucleotide mutase [Cyanobium sp.]
MAGAAGRGECAGLRCPSTVPQSDPSSPLTAATTAGATGFAAGAVRVAVIMGSDSDLPTMAPAVELLESFGVACEVRVLSAHRTPLEMVAFAQAAAGRGLQVIIAGAGGAAHLPGMVASLTTLPVIGVPVQSRALSGVDSLHSIVQMPGGIPVATVAIGGGLNAGLLAARILATADADLASRLAAYAEGLHDQVVAKDARLQAVGSATYLVEMGN